VACIFDAPRQRSYGHVDEIESRARQRGDMKLQDLCRDICALSAESSNPDIADITADSREVEAESLFAALPGFTVDGAKFVGQAIAKGAVAVLAAESAAFEAPAGFPIPRSPDPRRALALMAARLHAPQPRTIVAVTGTNGKTSIVSFVRQIWAGLGHQAASLGTVGLVTPKGEQSSSHTTPEPVALHRMISELAREGVTHLAVEASSHGLEQRRLDGLVLAAGAFTNITRDHLDHHKDFEDYFAQKLRLFGELLPKGAAAVINMDDANGARAGWMARRGSSGASENALRLVTVGRTGETIRLVSAERDGFTQRLVVACEGKEFSVHLPLVGDFQASNALVAAGLAMATGGKPAEVFAQLEVLQGAKGRLEHVGTSARRAPVFIDYAHTPDALANALASLRPYAGRRLVVVFGCGGDRDKGKRPLMGRIAIEHADMVIVTDDNPRTEDAAQIRAEILAGAADATEIGDRQAAISAAVAGLGEGDVLLVAGKGHESGQIVGKTIIPFTDHAAVAKALGEAGA
jgi:UDP-N-acetylmuramoyl-L-alanyl-D-glutamate--2,6-diaminopimelate ligase